MITKLYLAHPILDREWIRKEEARIEQELGIELINPFYDNAERNDMKRVDAGQLTVYDDKLVYKAIVEGDLKAIDSAQGIVAILTENLTVGTLMEIFYNAYTLKRPTYLVIMNAKIYNHPWIKYCATRRFTSLGEFESWMKTQ